MASSTVMVAYRFRGYDYHVTLSVGDEKRKEEVMTIDVEDSATADQWSATFSADYIQDLTQKTGNYKQFDIFVSMVESALTKTSDSVTLDLLTYADLQLLRNQKTNATHASSEALNSKRYLILTYSVEFDRIHYPLPLPYLGKPDPVALLKTIRELRKDNEDMRKRISNEETMANESTMRDQYEKQLERALTQNSNLEKINEGLTNELAVFREGRASKEIRMLKGVVQSMEEDLLKEKNRHQRSAAKSQQELRRLNEEVERLRNAENDLKIRVRNLTTELSSFKRPGANFHSRVSPSPVRNSATTRPSRALSRTSANSARPLFRSSSQPRSSSHGRTPVKSSSSTTTATSVLAAHRSLSSAGAPRDRSSSASRRAVLTVAEDKLEKRLRAASGDRSRERGVSGSGLGTGDGKSQSRSRFDTRENKSSSSLVRYRSPSPSSVSKSAFSTSSLKRFDPTDYVRQKKEKEKERERRKSVEKRYKLGSGLFKGRGSAGGRSNSGGGGEAMPSSHPRGLMSASPEARSQRGRTSSGESVGTISRSSSMESLNSQRSLGASKKTKKNPLRQSNEKSTGSSNPGDLMAKNKIQNGVSAISTRPSVAEKENVAASGLHDNLVDTLQETLDDTTPPADPDNEMAEIDARLNALQNFMKSMGHD